ncbi:hypothetical protein FJ930_15495 [Mesorhizobium sp. B2-4-15]|uniref:hypothetical protein n=1 Tax=Mesorhizobium sp. B2-4-15 TaxID=2589934 RepID=UPI00114FBAC1|nr:hypothetical protein [Mesorhizobium sp. B2-4-15]TPK71493.1 hypothetical protein FJ930_15495 [Mesorhizobium sp. B2-4-15]
MILYTVLAIGWLAAWYFHPVLFALLDGATSLVDATRIARDARWKSSGAPIPMADDMQAFVVEVAPSDTGTTRSAGLAKTRRLDASRRRPA